MQNKNKLNNKKRIHLSGNDSYIKGDLTDTDTERKKKENRKEH